jgi:hypothetical protein
MIKLRFCRLKVPELLRKIVPIDKPKPTNPSASAHETGDDWTRSIEQPGLNHTVRLAIECPDPAQIAIPAPIGAVEVAFDTAHEGIMLDRPDLPDEPQQFDAHGPLHHHREQWCRRRSAATPRPAIRSDDTTSRDDFETGRPTSMQELLVVGSTALPFAGEWSTKIAAGATVSVRPILSRRPRPESDMPYKPSGDLSVRVRITRLHAARKPMHWSATPTTPGSASCACR